MADDNKPKKYIRYAIGEIILVVVGILIALQVNNWNEERKKERKFEVLLEQIYKSIYVEKEWADHNRIELIEQIHIIDQLLENDSVMVPPEKLIHILFYIDTSPYHNITDTKSLIQYLDYNSNNEKMLDLTKELATYFSSFFYDGYIDTNRSIFSGSITELLMQLNIPISPISFGLSSLNNFAPIDTIHMFFDDKEIQRASNLIRTKKFKATIKTLKSLKILMLKGISDEMRYTNSYLKLIKNKYPNIRLQYNNIGILGSALEFGYYKSIPMQLIDPINGIWEIDIYLNNGTVKFRDFNNWKHNWGGLKFPEGDTHYYGDNIPVQEGNYHVILNLSENTYKFIKTR